LSSIFLIVFLLDGAIFPFLNVKRDHSKFNCNDVLKKKTISKAYTFPVLLTPLYLNPALDNKTMRHAESTFRTFKHWLPYY
jgi:hypothetical protein